MQFSPVWLTQTVHRTRAVSTSHWVFFVVVGGFFGGVEMYYFCSNNKNNIFSNATVQVYELMEE